MAYYSLSCLFLLEDASLYVAYFSIYSYFYLVDAKPRLLCGARLEELSHLFFDYPFSRSVFEIFPCKLDISFRFLGQ